jgi:hypothetical protein
MRHTIAFRVLTLVVLALVTACGTSPEGRNGPEEALQGFYRALNDGHYDAAMALYGAEARRELLDPATASPDAFAEWARSETKNGGVSSVSVLTSTPAPEDPSRATVDYRVQYGDGSSVDRKVTLTLEDGEWKMGLIG